MRRKWTSRIVVLLSFEVLLIVLCLSCSSFSSVSALSGTSSNERRMESRARGRHPLLSLNLNLDSLAKSGAASRAQELLERIKALHQEGYYDASPDVVSYNSVLNAWKEIADPEKAMAFLETMKQEGAVQPDTISYNTVILAYAKNGQHRQAEALLRKMQEEGPNPDIITYNSVLYALASSGEKGTVEKAESLLSELIVDDDSNNNNSNNKNDHQKSFSSSVKADSSSFNTVLFAHSMAGSPLRAQEILDFMETMYAEGNDMVEPDVYSYSTVIQAWANCIDNLDAPFHAKQILERMESLCVANPARAKHIRPNVVTYTSVMSALAKSGAAQEANDILDRMIANYEQGKDGTVKPDTVAFSCVIDGWARSHAPNASDKALALLEQMKHMCTTYHDNWMAPNSQTYTSVLVALGRCRQWDACIKAERLLTEIEESPFPGVSLSIIHVNAVLDAYAKSSRANKAQYATKLLQKLKLKMFDEDLRPNTITYNIVISACANSFGDPTIRQEALQIAQESFQTIVRDHVPNSVSFSLFLKAIRKLVPKDHPVRFSLLQKCFRICCNHGKVNDLVLEQLKRACTDDEWQQVIPSSLATSQLSKDGNFRILELSLPPTWTMNAGR